MPSRFWRERNARLDREASRILGGPPRTVDKWLTRVSHGSQLALVALAAFGYVYTVLPLYTKALLEEQIAEKELRLRSIEAKSAELELENQEASKQLAAARDLIASRQRQLEEQSTQLADARRRVTAAQQALSTANNALNQRTQQFSAASKQAALTYAQLREHAMSELQASLILGCSAGVILRTDRELMPATYVQKVTGCVQETSERDDALKGLTQADLDTVKNRAADAATRIRNTFGPRLSDAIEREAKLVEGIKQIDETKKDASGKELRSSGEVAEARYAMELQKLRNRSEFEKDLGKAVQAEAEAITTPLE